MGFRGKNFLVSFVFPLLFILFLQTARLEGFIFYGTIFVGFLTQYFLIFWLFNFDVYPQGFITLLILPALWFGSFIVIYQGFVIKLSFIYQLVIVLMFLILQYYFVTTQSILNLSHFQNISLSQAAYTANSFYTVLTFFAVNLALFLIPGASNILSLLLTIVSFIVISSIFSALNSIDRSQTLFSNIIYIFVISLLLTIYSFGIINPDKIILLTILLAIVFRNIIILMLYSVRKVLSKTDYAQVVFECGLIGILLFLSLK